MTTTHALVPVAATLAFADRPIPWKLVAAAAIAAAAPDVDALIKHFLHLPAYSIYAHRGAAHSLFVAVMAGLLAAALHRRLGVRPLVAGVVITASMASHGMLDMMANSGLPVAYLWPLTSTRLFADWRPIRTAPVYVSNLIPETLARFRIELWQIIIPMFAAALAIRAVRMMIRGSSRPRRPRTAR